MSDNFSKWKTSISKTSAYEVIISLLDASKRKIIGLCGEPGVGKSTFATQLCNFLGSHAVIVPMDGFHLSNVVLETLGRRQRKGAIDTFDVDDYIALLSRLRKQQDSVVYAPEFKREIEEAIAGSIGVFPEHKIIITEGNYLLSTGAWAGVLPLLDECWYLQRNEDLRKKQLIERHVIFGKTLSEAQDWVDKVDEENASQIRKTKEKATRLIMLDEEE